MRTQKRVDPRQRKKQKKQQKYREKTLDEHARDGITMIFKKISDEDKKLYHVQRDNNGKEIHDLTISGSKELLLVQGKATVGYFDINCDGKHFLDVEIEYAYEGRIVRDNWGQDVIFVDGFTLNGMDHLQGPTQVA